jgi:NitT/TauT family transport system ATP-binding protein
MDWGRYAELFSYDEPSGEIFIEDNEIEDSAIEDNDIEVDESN